MDYSFLRSLKYILKYKHSLMIFLLFYFAFTALTYKDYGMTWDEPDVYLDGRTYYGYFFGGDNNSPIVNDVRYNAQSFWYSMVVYMLAGSSNFGNYERYHLFNMLLASILFITMYYFLHGETKYKFLALSGPVFLFFTPSFLGQIPGNPKDIPFAITFNLTLLIIYLLRKMSQLSPLRIITIGVAIGFSSGLRPLGLSLLLILPIFDLWINHKYLRLPWLKWTLREALLFILILAVSQSALVASWPYLGQDYISRLFTALNITAQFDQAMSTLYLGKMISYNQLPWHYLFVCIFIRLPIFVVLLFLISFLALKKKYENDLFVMIMIVLFLHAALWLVIRPSLYHGSRHYLFIYPQIVLLSACAFIALFEKFILTRRVHLWPNIILGLLVLSFIYTGSVFARLHPYQYIYYNEFIGGPKGADPYFELDYWAHSVREAVDWIDNEYPDIQKMRLFINAHCEQAAYYLTDRMEISEGRFEGNWDFAILNVGSHNNYGVEYSNKLVHSVERMGANLHGVFKK